MRAYHVIELNSSNVITSGSHFAPHLILQLVRWFIAVVLSMIFALLLAFLFEDGYISRWHNYTVRFECVDELFAKLLFRTQLSDQLDLLVGQVFVHFI